MFNSVGHDRYPHFTYNQNGFPSEEDQLCFVNAYIDEFRTLSQGTCLESLCEDLTVEKLLIEGKAFALLFHLVLAIWGKSNVGESKIKFGYKVMGHLNINFFNYFCYKLTKQFIQGMGYQTM